MNSVARELIITVRECDGARTPLMWGYLIKVGILEKLGGGVILGFSFARPSIGLGRVIE